MCGRSPGGGQSPAARRRRICVRSLSQLQTEFLSDLGKGEMLGAINLNAWQAMKREHASLKRAEPAAGIPKAFQSQNLHARRQPKAFPFRRGRNVNGMAHRGKAHLIPFPFQPASRHSRKLRPKSSLTRMKGNRVRGGALGHLQMKRARVPSTRASLSGMGER